MKWDYIKNMRRRNAVLARNGLIDHLLIVIAPLIVGGKTTPTLIDGNSFQSEAEFMGIKALKNLQSAKL